MSGHSKWSTIKRKKGALDAKRSKIFSRLVKEITIAVKEGGGADPDMNPRLRVAVQNAKGENMPKDNIERAINKAGKDGTTFEEATFEGYLPNGIAVFVECLTDNNNRTESNIRALFTKKGGSLGTNGSLTFLFDRKGVFTIPKKDDMDTEELQLDLIDSGMDDFDEEDEFCVVSTSIEDFGKMQKTLEEMDVEVANAELKRIPTETKELPLDEAVKILKTIESFEDDEDVQNIYHNLAMTDELMDAMEQE